MEDKPLYTNSNDLCDHYTVYSDPYCKCNRCPCCGKLIVPVQQFPVYPTYPTYPYPTWTPPYYTTPYSAGSSTGELRLNFKDENGQ